MLQQCVSMATIEGFHNPLNDVRVLYTPEAFEDGKEDGLIEGPCQISSMVPAAHANLPAAPAYLHVWPLYPRPLLVDNHSSIQH